MNSQERFKRVNEILSQIEYFQIFRNVETGMGLGKPSQVVKLIDYSPAIKKILVICPASLKANWFQKLEKMTRQVTIGVADGNGFPKDRDVVIVQYEGSQKYQEALQEIKWDLVIV